MINDLMFSRNNLLNSAVLGMTFLGYLGYRMVRYMNEEGKKTKKVNEVATPVIENPLPISPAIPASEAKAEELQESDESNSDSDAGNDEPPAGSLKMRVSDLEISTDKITMGQGEYIVFRKLPNGEREQLSRELFEQVYKILLKYAPQVMMNESEDNLPQAENRYELIRFELKELDPNLEAVFVPRTLYELIFIRKCIEEDLEHGNLCPFLTPARHYESSENKEAEQDKRNCWHLSYQSGLGDNEDPGVKKVAFRLNNLIADTLSPSSEGFTYQELSPFVEKEIKFLIDFHQAERINELFDAAYPGPTSNFAWEKTVKSMGIRADADAQIIRNAITLDCSKMAHNHIFLFRGAKIENDCIFSHWPKAYSPCRLSFNLGIFPAVVHDGAASTYYYLRMEKNDGFAIPVAFKSLKNSPFYVARSHTVTKLFGIGEVFHESTKVWKDADLNKIRKMTGLYSHPRDHLRSTMSRKKLSKQVDRYYSKAILIK